MGGGNGSLSAPQPRSAPPAKQSLTWRKRALQGKRGDPEAGSSAGRAASMASSGWRIGITALLVATTIVSVTALIGMALTAHYLVENVRRIDNRIGTTRVVVEGIEADIDGIEADIAVINETMPEGNGTVFFDDEWVMAHGADHTRQFTFDASLITTSHPGARRSYALPDEDGTLALLADIPAGQSEFADDAFALYLAGEASTRVEFDLAMITTGATRIYELPNKDGTVALLSDISTLGGSNQTVFLDSDFAIENDPDTSRIAMFDASQIVGLRTVTFPDLDGVLALTEGAQTIHDKTLVANSTLIGGPGGAAQFNADALTTTRTYTLTDRDQVLVGRMSIDWGLESMGWSTDPETYSYIRVASTFQRDRFFQFAAMGSGTGGDVGRAGIELTWFNQHSYRMYTAPGGGFELSYSQGGIPATNNALGSPLLRIEPVNGMINFVDRTDSAKRARFDISGLTAARTFAFPDQSGTLALEGGNGDTTSLAPQFITNRLINNWSTRTSAADNQWLAIAWSPELGLFAAVAWSGLGNRVMTSPDGITWTIRSSAADNPWFGIAWSPELGLFAAVARGGTGNRVMTSPDGINWATRTSAADNNWRSIAWSPELGLFAAVADTGSGNRVMTSPDGITWTIRSSAADNQWYGIAWSPELGLFAAVAITGSGNRVMTSPDGINWTIRTSAVDNSWTAIAWSPELGLFAAVAWSGTGNRVMTSPDGVNWTIRTSAADNDWWAIAWSPELGLFAAVAVSGSGNRIMTSPDGINWATRTSAANNNWRGIAWSPELGLFAAVADSGTGNRVMTSGILALV